jgi:hypothetical protein
MTIDEKDRGLKVQYYSVLLSDKDTNSVMGRLFNIAQYIIKLIWIVGLVSVRDSDGQYGLVLAILILETLITIIFRPYASGLQNTISSISNLLVVIVVIIIRFSESKFRDLNSEVLKDDN